MTVVDLLPGEGMGGFGVAGAIVLRPGAMPDGLTERYAQVCAEAGIEDPPTDGIAVCALYGPNMDGSLGRLSLVTTLVADTEVGRSRTRSAPDQGSDLSGEANLVPAGSTALVNLSEDADGGVRDDGGSRAAASC